MSYDIEHKDIYSLAEAPVKVHGMVVIGGRHTIISADEDGSFTVTVSTKPSDLDPQRMDIVHITPVMLDQMLKSRKPK